MKCLSISHELYQMSIRSLAGSMGDVAGSGPEAAEGPVVTEGPVMTDEDLAKALEDLSAKGEETEDVQELLSNTSSSVVLALTLGIQLASSKLGLGVSHRHIQNVYDCHPRDVSGAGKKGHRPTVRAGFDTGSPPDPHSRVLCAQA